MKKLMNALLALTLFAWPAFMVQAQQPIKGQVSGRLLEPATKEPVAFAAVGLFAAKDSALVSATTSDEAGNFLLTNLAAGQYYLHISLVGFTPKKLSNLQLSGAQPHLELGTVMVNPVTRKISEVEIVAQKELVEYGLDKQVINVAKDIASTGGTASDALKNAPSVAVDIEGNVSVRGSSNVTVLVDGKNSGQSAQTILSQLPASAIEKIEVITNPSARYDAEGMGGIINIILKKERKPGLNGNLGLNLGTSQNYSGSLNLNYAVKKFNFFGGYEIFRNVRTNTYQLYSFRSRNYLEQNQDGRRRNVIQLPKLGFDYQLSPNQTISLSAKSFRHAMEEEETVFNEVRPVNQPAYYFTRQGNFENTVNGTDLTFSYRKTFADKRRELTGSAVYTLLNGGFDRYLDQFETNATRDHTGPRQQENYLQDFSVRPLVAQLDYVHPVSEKGKLETGAKHTQRQLTTHFRAERFDPAAQALLPVDSLSDRFRYSDYISAGYVNYSNAWKKLSYQFGLRAEQTNLRMSNRNLDTVYTTGYLNFFPSIFLSQEIDENRKVQVNFSRRVNRPNYEAMNPFKNYTDQYNIWSGNPQLRPEYIEAYEASYIQFWKTGSLTNTVFYRNVHNLIQQVRFVDPVDSLVAFNNYVNLDDAKSYGLEISGNQTLAKWWKVSGNVSGFNYKVMGRPLGVEAGSDQFSWLARVNSNFTLPQNLTVQISVNYRSPQALAQGTRGALYNTDVALKKDVLKKRGSVTLRVSDVFNTLAWNTSITGQDLTYDLHSKRLSRIAFLGFNYRFGNDQEKRKRPEAASGLDNMF